VSAFLRKLEIAFWDRIEPLLFDPVAAADHDYECAFLKSHEDLSHLLPVPLEKASLLSAGCGYRYPDVSLYSGLAASVQGLDVSPLFYRDGFGPLYRLFRAKGKGVALAAVTAWLKRRGLERFYQRLAERAGRTLLNTPLSLTSYDGGVIPFPDASFHAVFSNAVLEHVQEPKKFFAETKRVTKPGGIAYHLYHNYFSLSGNHLPPVLYKKRPWGHLRGLYRTDPGHLNGFSIDRMREAFSVHFEVLGIHAVGRNHVKKGVPGYEPEGLELLTPALRAELSAFPEEWLLTRSFLLIGRVV